MWWISDVARFQNHYPEWKLTFNVEAILQASFDHNVERWLQNDMAVTA